MSSRPPGLPTPSVQRRAQLVPGSRTRDHPDRPAAGRARGRRRRGPARSVLAVRRARRPAAARPALAVRAPLAARRVPVLRGRPLPGSAARARVPGLVTTRSARRRPAWARPRRPALGSATVTVSVTVTAMTVTVTVVTVTAVTAARVLACPAGPALAGPGPAVAVPAGLVVRGPAVPARTPMVARVLAARVPVARVLAR